MRIGLIGKFNAPDGLSTRGNAVLKGLIENGHDVHVFTQSKIVEGLPEEKLHRISALKISPHLYLDSIGAIRMIAQQCKARRIDVLHVQMNSGTTELIIPFFRKLFPPLVVTFHLAYTQSGVVYTAISEIAWRISLWAAQNYNEVILVDPSQKPFFLSYGIPEGKISIIQNGVDVDKFRPLSKKLDVHNVGFVYIGRLSFEKGINLLLRAFAKYHSENTNSRLTLIGDGLLKTQINRFTTDGSVRWLGSLPHSRIPQILQKMDVFVIPQIIGGLSYSVMEAMSCGLPVITTPIGETRKLLSKNEGVLVEPNNTDRLVEAMRLLGKNHHLRMSMGENCRKKIERYYSWDRQIASIEKTYERAITNSLNKI